MNLKVVKNNIIPFSGYKAITILFWIFTRADLNDIDYNHENIHFKQQVELFFIFFYLWYIIEFLIKLIYTRNWKVAYRSISFEQEAYERENNLNWTEFRTPYYWTKFINKVI